jgi:hypothetical protein
MSLTFNFCLSFADDFPRLAPHYSLALVQIKLRRPYYFVSPNKRNGSPTAQLVIPNGPIFLISYYAHALLFSIVPKRQHGIASVERVNFSFPCFAS